jgi:L-ascorbate metabolism protein UlaG (beta-lactamase superfamily)
VIGIYLYVSNVRMNGLARRRFVATKLGQLWRLVRESHEQPMAGVSRLPELVTPGELGVTFIGHSSFLLQVGGKNVLVDPVFSKRLILLRRQRRAGLRVEDLPRIDLVLLTHAHMDHLDMASLRRVVRATQLLARRTPEVVVPKGVEDLVARLGFARVHAMEWWQQLEVQGLRVTMTPCRHWGARMFNDTHRGYGGYVVESGGYSVYHSGDTAYFDGFREIGRRLKPEVALLPIGAYFPDSYRAVHTSPEEAARAFMEVGAEWMVPMHFGTFRLGREPMEEPVERLGAEATRLEIRERVRVLEEGETLRL